jgi:phosphopantetheinyl transferase
MHINATCTTLWIAPVLDGTMLGSVVADLGIEERARCERIRHKGARERFLTGRAMAKFALCDATSGYVRPSDWRIETAATGKPVVRAPRGSFGISIAHSGDMVAVAMCPDGDVGVDIERLDEENAGEPLSFVLSSADARKLAACEPRDRAREFLKLWTMKEALAKRSGKGLGMDFARLDFDWSPGHAEQTISTRHADIHVRLISRQNEYCVALASPAGAPRISFENLEARLFTYQPGDLPA